MESITITIPDEHHRELEANVARGAALLDAHRPDWREGIDVSTLVLNSCSRCVLGQLFGDYTDGMLALSKTEDETNPCSSFGGPFQERAEAHGFTLPGRLLNDESLNDAPIGTWLAGRYAYWNLLRDLWTKQVQR